MKSDKNIDLIIDLINKFPTDLTEKLKLNQLNEELKKKGSKTISRTTYYKLKRNYPEVFISNKNAEKKAKQKSRTDYQSIKKDCIKVLFLREKISIDETKSNIEKIVLEDGSGTKRRRTNIMFTYVINEIHPGSSVDDNRLIGLELTQSKFDILRSDGKEVKPSIKALTENSLKQYDQKLCEDNDLEWIETTKGTRKNPSKIVFTFIKGRFKNFKGKLDRDSLRDQKDEFNDPRTLFNNEERFKWLKQDLAKKNCRILDKEWKGSRKRVTYLCPHNHFNDPLLTNYFQSRNEYSCPECNEGGFDPSKPAWFYLMERDEEQQFGITNNKEQRLKYHEKNKWKEIEVTANSHPGKEVQDVEKKLKVWLKKEVELLPHRTERWNKKKKNIKSLKQLKKESGVETSIF